MTLTVKLIAFALSALIVFVAIWFFVVIPAEKRHHERKLAAIRKQLADRQTANNPSQRLTDSIDHELE